MPWTELYGFLHIPFHFILPLVIYRWSKDRSQLLMLELANAIDIDHLLAVPIFEAGRCSLTTHPLHGSMAALCYLCLLALPGTVRALGAGALLHLAIDAPSCL